jgi:phosphoglycolate phosphatase
MRTAVFDLDGTLADTSADLVAAANACLAEAGVAARLDPVADAALAFAGGRAMLRAGFARAGLAATPAGGEAAVAAAYPRLLAFYAAGIDRHTRLYDGAAEAVEALRQAGWAVAVCTNKPVDLAELLLARLGVRGLFDALVGAGSLPERKPDPAPFHAAVARAGGAPGRAFLVGDTETDLITARAAGAPVALVTFGPEGRGIARLAPDALLDRFADLPDLAARLVP